MADHTAWHFVRHLLFDGKWRVGIRGVRWTLVDVCNLLIVTILLIPFGCNAPCKFWGFG